MDEKLINEAIAGSKEAFASLYGEYKDKLYRYALYRLGNPSDAEDAVSECILAAWRKIGSLRSSRAFGSWIFSILHACCASRIKAAIRDRSKLEQMSSKGLAENEPYISPALSTELSEALSLLNDEAREIVLLSVIGDMSSKEIASITGLTAGSVRSKLSRSLATMRNYLT